MTIPATDIVALAVLAGALAGAAFCDVRQYLIPDRFPVAIALSYPLYAVGHPAEHGLWALGVGFAVLVVGVILFATNVMGGGDTKLLAAVGLWAGPDLAAVFLFDTALAGAAIGIAWLTPIRRLMPAAPIADGESVPGAIAGWRARLRQPVPYGVAIALGGFHLAALRAFH